MATLIPLGDASRRPRRFAVVTLLIILANTFVFLQELTEGDAFVARWALIPANIVHGHSLITLVTGLLPGGVEPHEPQPPLGVEPPPCCGGGATVAD